MSASLTLALTDKVKAAAAEQRIALDTYDVDFLLGVMMQWLSQHDAVLTESGVDRRDGAA